MLTKPCAFDALGASLWIQVGHTGRVVRSVCIEAITPRRTSLARNNDQLRIGT